MLKDIFAVQPVHPTPHVDAGKHDQGPITGEIPLKRALTARHLVMLGIGAIISLSRRPSPEEPPSPTDAP